MRFFKNPAKLPGFFMLQKNNSRYKTANAQFS